MNIKILAKKEMFPSARLLRGALQNITGNRIWITQTGSKITSPFVVRWGSLEPISTRPIFEINTINFIKLCAKKSLSDLLTVHENKYFSVVKFYSTMTEPKEYPVIIREDLYSFGGQGIHIVTGPTEFKNFRNVHWSPWINMTSEFRVHIIGGKIIRVFKKELKDENVEFPIRNSSICNFSLRTNLEKFPKLQEVVNVLAKTLGKDSFLGLDIGYDSNNKKYIVIEANTAPGLNEHTANCYAEEIYKIFKEKEK